jgi:hypothetical protein
MFDSTSDDCAEKCQTWVGHGVRLEIVAQELPDGQWTLAVINKRGVMSIWHELFVSAEAALETARRAIEDEGIGDFVDIEGFDYLDE